jgi:hypothetical protein
MAMHLAVLKVTNIHIPIVSIQATFAVVALPLVISTHVFGSCVFSQHLVDLLPHKQHG